ncbi:energy-coupling factor transporter transmembrane component T [Kibdelosporangium phytohabitans]|uniref:Cobalt ABC transporter permease n=1 Tax=Kibdelosporangium phytohabitans TaxID=860235 RepID=A0A0N9HVJ3_9PSEU|nr:energy-coupling factor transporter transmembrane component T [Kibdelosporangium phytohabitans]ALG09130.1 cobalt ABC transporter permease [Kibdelosporangium phytohabitans]MBE1469660.1 energy-coupling factor transport system permease protein [Kibdelosporangium phytohabitans]
MRGVSTTYFLPRDLHPAAWWVWALGLAVAASRTTNPWLLLTIIAVAGYVVVCRRTDAPWALAFRIYVYLGMVIIAVRVFFRIVFGGAEGSTIILSLPEIPLPAWAAGIRLFGDVSAESLLGGLYDGLRLATMVICLGAANALANPKRLLKAMPPALYEVGTAVIVALSVFPQLAESVLRVRQARKLRGGTNGKRFRALHAIIIPVLEDALDRSLRLAASMDSRGYGRAGKVVARTRLFTGALMIVGLLGVCVGVYATLDGSTPRFLAGPVLFAGAAIALVGFRLAGNRVKRTRYRPDRWQPAEVVVALSGIAVAVVLFLSSSVDPTNLNPSLIDLSWPLLSWVPLGGVLLGVLPSFLTPPPLPPFAGQEEPSTEPERVAA